MDWCVDLKSGHCQLGGLTALVDPRPTRSGAIRCVGPFGPWKTDSQAAIQLSMSNLMAEVEEITGGYVVWGVHNSDPIEDAKSATFLGIACTFIPCLLVRTKIMLEQSIPLLGTEWRLDQNSLYHKAGIRIELGSREISLETPDMDLIDDRTLEENAHFFLSHAQEIAGGLFQETRKRA